MALVIQALVLGVVQGLTEFLPISSSGHLILVPAMLGWENPFVDSLLFGVVLHLGTLVALLSYFARDWATVLGALPGLVRERRIGEHHGRRLLVNLLVATIPAAIAGYLERSNANTHGAFPTSHETDTVIEGVHRAAVAPVTIK